MERRPSLMALALAAALSLAPLATCAQGEVLPPKSGGAGEASSSETVTSDSWLGALAAVGCGFMVRATIATGGTQVATIAGAVACCGYMLFDALVVEAH